MSFFKNTVSLLALFSVVPMAHAVTARSTNDATARVSVGTSITGASRRMPTMTAYITNANNSTTTGVGSTVGSSALLANAECIDAYTSCIKGGDACGPNFEECTNKVLFHGKMPQCLSTLAQCASAGINSLFGTSAVNALSTIKSKNTYGEVTDYTYPTDGSVLGQMITAAAISNQYDTASCIRRYSSCLKKDSVCGADFELCTTNTEFKKQAVLCDSTLARCQSEGKLELFGNAGATSSTAPMASSRVGEMIAEGAALAATNAVSTCYKVVDQCILGACGANPYKCYENASQGTVDIVETINSGTEVAATSVDPTTMITKSNIASYIKNSCLDTVGGNKYCYATFLGDGMMPTASQLRDEDNQEEVYDLAYGARMNSGMKAKITELVNKFDTKAKEKCVSTIKSCAMRTCGGGSGAACYSQVFGATDKSINNAYTRNEIRTGCLSVVNSDANCKYASQNPNSTGTYNYMFTDATAFDTLFPEYDAGAENDPIGVIASLNASLANNYNDAAIAKMKKQCQSVATSCVRSMCGNDFVNCYRNRTDIYSSLTNSGDSSYDKSMNKVGGVLDYTIVLGLCVDTVKNASVCTEHLAIETNKAKINNQSPASWGTGSVRNDWIDGGATSQMTLEEGIHATDANGNELCLNSSGEQGPCYSVNESGDIYETPVMISQATYVESQAASSLFKDLIYDLEIEAQAKYNAKLTKQQNLCLSSNDGGIIGNKDLGSTFLWAKLNTNKVPANYSVSGLKANQFKASNELYGSFCRVRVTLHSNDIHVQDALSKGADWSTAYFAAGDAFTCGSWIPKDKLEKIADAAGKDARDDKAATQPKIKGWMTALGALGLGGGGAALGAAIHEGDAFSGLSGIKKSDKFDEDKCDNAYNKVTNAIATPALNNSVGTYVNELIQLVRKNGKDSKEKTTMDGHADDVRNALNDYNNAVAGLNVDFQDIPGAPTPEQRTCTDAEADAYASEVAIQYLNGYGYNTSTVTQSINGKDLTTWTGWMSLASDGHNNVSANNSSLTESGLTSALNSINVNYETYKSQCKKYNTTTTVGRTAASQRATAQEALNTATTNLMSNVQLVYQDCLDLANEDDDEGKLSKGAAAGIGAAVGAVAGGILGYTITDSIQNAALDKAEQDAIREFMENVGSKIQCYIGGDEVGSYGEVISTSME